MIQPAENYAWPMELPKVSVRPPFSVHAKQAVAQTIEYESPAGNAPGLAQKPWPVIWKSGRGVIVEDVDGNTYLDLTSGFVVTNAGHCHPKVVAAIKEQAGELLYAKSHAPHPERARLAEILARQFPGGEKALVQFAVGGAEAIQVAIKFARYLTGRHGIIAFGGSYHGKTGAALDVTGRASYKVAQPQPGGIQFLPFPDQFRPPLPRSPSGAEYVEFYDRLLCDPSSGYSDVAAIILESIQGAEGINVPPDDFLPALRALCDRHRILMIADEIQTGFGRTGRRFGIDHWGVVPDLIVVGKGVAGGLPLSGVLGKQSLMEKLPAGLQTSTFAGNPLGWASALATLEVYEEEGLYENAARMGEEIVKAVRQLAETCPFIGDVRGKGLLIGLDLVAGPGSTEPNPQAAAKLAAALLERGVLMDVIGRHNNVAVIRPPLVIQQQHVDWLVSQLEDVLREL